MLSRYFLIAALLLSAAPSHASERSVAAEFLNMYDKRIRSTKDDLLPTNVTIFPDIQNLIAMIEDEETVKLLIFLRLSWRDDWLVWNPSDHNGTDVIRIPGTEIWLPDITILSSLETIEIMPDEEEIVQVDCDGTVHINKPLIVSNYCPMRIAHFPFDEQDCIINISPWGYTARQVTVYDSGSSITMKGNSEWMAEFGGVVENIVNVKENTYKELHYTVRFKRNPAYYVWVLILPTFLITSLSIVGIFMPSSSSGERIEKVSLGLATLLTLAVILNIVSEEMPKGADLPMLGSFVMAEILICLISLIVSIGTLQIHHRVSTRFHPPPQWIYTLLFLPKTEEMPEKPLYKGHPIAAKTASGNRSMKEQKGLKRELTRNSIWTANQPSIWSATNEKSPPQDFSDDLKQLLIELRAYLEKINLEEATVEQWIRIFDRTDAFFLVSFQIIHVVVSALLLL